MTRDKWTQQLREKLAEHEAAAPEGLWDDIEAALAQQPAPAQQPQSPAPAPQPQQPQPRSRLVPMRRWAVAASIALLLSTGGYLWWKAQPLPSPQGESLAQPLPSLQGESLAQPLPSPQGEGQGVGSVTSSSRTLASHEIPKETLQTPPLTPPLEGRGGAAPDYPQAPDHPQQQEAASTQQQTPPPTQQQMPEEPQRQLAELPQHTHTGRPVAKTSHRLTLGLYAMNGFDNQSSSNGVMMAGSLAQQYMNTYANSYEAAARSTEPIYLTGYEEQQHHHRPVTYGLTLSYPLTDRLALTTGVVYTQLRSDFTQVMRSQQIHQRQTLHYIGIPLHLNYRLWAGKGLSAYLAAGAKADWNVATRLETEGVSQHLPKDRLQWSLDGSLGLQYDIMPRLGLYVEPGLSWYPDNGSSIQNYFKDKPLNFTLQLGLRLRLHE